MADPTFYADGNTPNLLDPPYKVLQKILGATIDGGGGGGGGSGFAPGTGQYQGNGPPPNANTAGAANSAHYLDNLTGYNWQLVNGNWQ